MKCHLEDDERGQDARSSHRRHTCYGELGGRVRHGVRPPTSAAVLEMPVAPGVWAPDAADLAALGSAGRVLVEALLARYDFAPVEGRVSSSRRAMRPMRWRRCAPRNNPTSSRSDMEMQWSKPRGAARATACGEAMKPRATAATPDPRHVRWLDKWGNPAEGFTRDLLAIRRSRAPRRTRRRSWPTVRRAVWGNSDRFRIPSAAELFDGITFESCGVVRDGWHDDDFPLEAALRRSRRIGSTWPRFGRASRWGLRRLPTTSRCSRRISR